MRAEKENFAVPEPPGVAGSLMSLADVLPDIDRSFGIHRGKVRDSVDLGERLLVVATDRISTFDVVHPNGVPDKGIRLTQMTLRWLYLLSKVIPNHLLTANIEEFPEPFNNDSLRDRSMLVQKLRMVPIECIARGYITGSAMVEYNRFGSVCGIQLPPGLIESQRLDEPIFTPSTKETVGHDRNIDFRSMEEIIASHFPELDPNAIANDLKEKTLLLYTTASDFAHSCGVIIADTKFEFGIDENGKLVLADEVLTPDSSRFWDAEKYTHGRSQDSLDKQYVRDYVTSIGWNKEPPAPILPSDIVNTTSQKYAEVQKRLFG